MSCRSIIRVLCALFALFLLTHCTAKPAVIKEVDQKQLLRARAAEYWDLMININSRNVEKIYQYEAPSFREKVSFVEYIHRFKMYKYLGADIKEIEIEGNRGKVTVVSTYVASLPKISNKGLTRIDDEKWVRVEGIWFHFPREWVTQD